MKVTFVANFMNHHQLPFSLEMQRLTDGGYTFVAFDPLAEEQRNLGYYDMNALPFIIRAYENEAEYNRAMDVILNDDMVIFGSCPDEVVAKRAATGKPFIIYSERFFKKGTYRRFIPITYKKIYNRLLRYENHDVSIICSSAYLPYDIKLLRKKFEIYKWGYFPQVSEYDIEKLIEKKKQNEKIIIAWTARFISWKHPEVPVMIAEKLKQAGYDFQLNMIGVGPLLEKTKEMVKSKGLDDYVNLLGSKTPDDVRKEMDKADIFMVTSDFQEGWGAVMNESMNSACAVVANHGIGSAPFLIDNGKNGFVYKNGNIEDLYKKVKYLCDNSEKRIEMGKAAYETITKQWCAENATRRLYNIIKAKVEKTEEPVYKDGPCSKAEIITHKYRKGNYDKI